MDGHFVGPMPVADFLRHFLSPPSSDPSAPTCGLQFEGGFPSSADQVIQTIESANVCQRLRFEAPSPSSYKPSPQIIASIPNAESSTATHPSYPALFIDTLSLDDDPFLDPELDDERPRSKVPFQRGSRKRVMNRRQLTSMARQLFEEYPRIFLFSILIIEDKARLIRWDHSGVVVTERFDWLVEDSPLAMFLRLFDASTPEQRGLDPTVSFPTPEEAIRAQAVFERSVVDACPDNLLCKFAVTDEVTGETRHLVAGRPQASGRSLAGRATSGYVAVDLQDDSLVWLKDSWRLDIKTAFKEADIYRRLSDANVPHVSSMLVGGDVLGHQTESQKWIKSSWACWTEGVGAYRHHRIVLNTVARPLKDFKSTHELTTAVRDAIEAHFQAYTKLNILHADISAGNIMITADGRGLLIDWELAFDVEKETRMLLTGTWQFASAARLEADGTKVHTLQDDLESFVHVFVYHLVRYRPTSIRDLESAINSVYHKHYPGEESWRSSDGKVSFFCGNHIYNVAIRDHFPTGAVLLVQQLRRLFWRAYYAADGTVEEESQLSARETLASSTGILALFDTHIAMDGWLESDASKDTLEAPKEKGSSRKRNATAADDSGRSAKKQCSSSSRDPSTRGSGGVAS
ncbi:hypothetical protein OF83DRAFT_1178581 [Amylostereum chailletii]|nr:hypothetical protein OF83DRAFT_1178581 [Amylostereum chailletii]